MSRAKTSKTHKAAAHKEWPAVVYFWTFGMLFLGYVLGRIVLSSLPHPYHWASGLAGGVLGFGLGWLWYRKRGDVF